MDLVEIGREIRNLEGQNLGYIKQLNFLGFNIWKVYRNAIVNQKYASNYKAASDKRLAKLGIYSAFKNIGKLKDKIILRATSAQYSLSNNQHFSNRLLQLKKSIGASNTINMSILMNRHAFASSTIKLIPGADLSDNFIKFYRAKLKYFLLPCVLLISLRHFSVLKKFTPLTLKQVLFLNMNFLTEYYLYRILYMLIRPKKVLYLFASYGCEAEIAALKKQNVEIMEYQHGHIYSEHYGYNYHMALKPIKNKLLLPDKFYLYGRYWKDILTSNGFYSESEIEVHGNPDFQNIEEIKIDPKGKIPILLCSQPDAGNLFREFLNNYNDQSAYKNDYHWLIKLHPRESIDDWQKFVDRFDNMELVEYSVYPLLKQVNLQVTSASTTVYEGLYFNVTNYIIINSLNINKSIDISEDIEIGKYIDINYIGEFVAKKNQRETIEKYFEDFSLTINDCRD